MILSSETSPQDAQQMLEFYKQHFAVVEIVSCKDCGSMLAFECSGGDGMGLAPNELGKYVIPIGDNLLSSRVRLDEAPTGEPMIGYQCGAQVDNPLYPMAVKQYEEDLAAYDAEYKKKEAQAEKDFKKVEKAALKAGDPVPLYNPPFYDPPVMPKVSPTRECGNDTRISEVELGKVPVGRMQSALSPFEKHQIRQQIKADKKYKPNFKKVGNIKHFESFQVERV